MIKKITLLTAAIELITVFFRFALEMKAGETTKAVSALTLGVRIHHGYVGLALITAGVFFSEKYKTIAFITGASLFLSDLIHHFVVLKLITGSAEFDIFYR